MKIRLSTIIFLFLVITLTSASASEIKYRKTLFYEINFNSPKQVGYTKDVEHTRSDCPYNIVADWEGNVWIVDPVKRQCLVVTGDKKVKIFMKGKEFDRIDRKYGFNILVADKDRLILGSCVLSKKKKVLMDFKGCLEGMGMLSYLLIHSAGFMQDNGIFAKQFDFLLVTDGKGKTVLSIPLWKVLPVKNEKAQIVSYYYDRFRNRSWYVKFYKGSCYLVDSSGTKKFNMDKYMRYSFIKFIDRKGSFYLSDNYFKAEGDARYSTMMIFDRNLKYLGSITVTRIWERGTGKFISREDIVGITPGGDVFITKYIHGKGVEIYRLQPE